MLVHIRAAAEFLGSGALWLLGDGCFAMAAVGMAAVTSKRSVSDTLELTAGFAVFDSDKRKV
jgi:glycerol uptake facilitator-like aquaporin